MKIKLALIIILCTLISGCSNANPTISSTDETQPTTLSTETTEATQTTQTTTAAEVTSSEVEATSAKDESVGSELTNTLSGVAYNLGVANTNYEASVIKISGTVSNPSSGVESFGGVFEIDGREYQLNYSSGGSNLLSYASKAGYTRTFGQAFMNEDFSEIVILVIEDGWSSNEGPMLTYPAINKEEALEIANRLMADYLADMEMEKLR